MIFLRITPTMKVTFKKPQDVEINLTGQMRSYYHNKLKDRENSLVEATGLNVPLGKVQGGATYITPELTLTSLSEEALTDFANSFFSNEETDLFIIHKEPANDLSNL